MSAQVILPTAQAPSLRAKPFTWHMIPLLRDLLPKQQGRPGFIYAQVCVTNLRLAQDQGWSEVDGTAVYTIVGPKGQIDMKLMAQGSPLRGVGHASGKRRCVVDIAVEDATGHQVKTRPLNTTTTPKEPTNGGTISKPQATQEQHGNAQRSSGKL